MVSQKLHKSVFGLACTVYIKCKLVHTSDNDHDGTNINDFFRQFNCHFNDNDFFRQSHFQRVILMSGSIFSGWARVDNPAEVDFHHHIHFYDVFHDDFMLIHQTYYQKN